MGTRLIPLLLCLLSLLSLSACSTLFTVKSDPAQADVSYLDPATGEKKPLGKTPMEMPSSTLRKTVGDGVATGQYFTLVVEKSGYLTEKLLVPASRFGTLVTSVELKLKQGDAPKQERLAKEILDHLFLAQKLAMSRQYERAQLELDRILAESPEFARAFSLRASIYFVQKNYADSLKWYEAALKADPQMEDAVQMTARIRTIQAGGDGAAAAASARIPAQASSATEPAKDSRP